jgi:hypothetical protein
MLVFTYRPWRKHHLQGAGFEAEPWLFLPAKVRSKLEMGHGRDKCTKVEISYEENDTGRMKECCMVGAVTASCQGVI